MLELFFKFERFFKNLKKKPRFFTKFTKNPTKFGKNLTVVTKIV